MQHHEFVWIEILPWIFPSLLALFFFALLGATIGSYLYVKQMNAIVGSLSHGLLGTFAFALWIKYLWPLFSWGSLEIVLILSSLFALLLHHFSRFRGLESLLSWFWIIGMSMGFLLIRVTPGYQQELLSFLLGNIFLVASRELVYLGILSVLTVVFFVAFNAQIKVLAFDQAHFLLRGGAWFFERLLFVLMAWAIVLLSRMSGIVLSMAFILLPATVAALWASSWSSLMIWSFVLSFSISLLSLFLAFWLDLPFSALFALSMSFLYVFVYFIKQKMN